MPLFKNKFQPYFPDPNAPSEYACGRESYCHPVNQGDVIRNQFYQTPCGASLLEDPDFSDISLGAELITNGTFTGSAASWVLNPTWVYNILTDAIDHTSSLSPDTATQTGLAIVAGSFYELTIDITRTSGFLNILLGGVAVATVTDTGVATFIVQAGNVNDHIVIQSPGAISGFNDFVGSVTTISLKEVTFGSWNPFGDWLLDNGVACPLPNGGSLIETVPDYLLAGNYYQFTFSVTGYQAGLLEVYISDILAGTITSGGIFTLYATPTVDGVIEFRAGQDSIFCIDLTIGSEAYPAGMYQLRNDYSGNIIDAAGDSVYNLDLNFFYFEDYVTLNFDFDDIGLPYGCYTYVVYDACLISGVNLVTNGTFASGQTGWNGGSSGWQYDSTGGDLDFIFTPPDSSDYVVNGDFATGDFTGWTASGGLAVVANEVVHTPGTADTLTQSIVLPPPAPPGQVLSFFVSLTISGRTAGSVSALLGDVARSGFNDNDVITFRLNPTVGGAQPLTLTFSSDFDGTVDDITLFSTTAVWSGAPFVFNDVNPLMVAGNYELSFEIIGATDPRISVGLIIQGQTQATVYQSTVGVHTFQITNYVPGQQRAVIIANFAYLNYAVLGSITVDNISVRRIEPFEATYTSECLNYQFEHPHTKMLQGYCDQPAFGFEFTNTGFRLQQRAEIRSFGEQYPDNTEISRSGNGNMMLNYSSVEKYWPIHTDFGSSAFHAANSAIIRCDHFGIGNTEQTLTEYVAEPGSYFIAWQGDGSYSLATALFNVYLKVRNQLFNRHL